MSYIGRRKTLAMRHREDGKPSLKTTDAMIPDFITGGREDQETRMQASIVCRSLSHPQEYSLQASRKLGKGFDQEVHWRNTNVSSINETILIIGEKLS